MPKRSSEPQMEAIIVDETMTYTLREVCEACGIYAEQVIEMVEYGIVFPSGKAPQNWSFRGDAVFRLKKTMSLCDDLGVNLAGAGLALDLLEELDRLHRELDQLTHRTP